MNEANRAILIGMVIGDGHISPHPRHNTATLTIKHSAKQLEYAEHKSDIITSILGGKRPGVRLIDNNGFPGAKFQKTDKYFRVLRNWIYLNGKKDVSGVIRWLTPQGLAYWYMDDGGLGIKRRRGKIHAIDLYINCHTSLPKAEEICRLLFDKFGITFIPNLNNRQYRIRCGTREARRFAEIVGPFIVSGMRYKIDPVT